MQKVFYTLKAVFNRPVEKIIYMISGFFPRNKKVWVFGAQKKQFYCNPKHFFIWTSLNRSSDISCIWLSESEETVETIRGLGLPAERSDSIKGVFYRLRAGFYFYNCSIKDIGFQFSKGAVCINLWHGVPLKKIEGDHRVSERQKFFANNNWLKVVSPRDFFSDTYVLSTAPYVTEKYFSSAFGKKPDAFINLGYPRTDILFKSRVEAKCFFDAYELGLDGLLSELEGFDKVYLYAPTWRDSEVDFIQLSGLDLESVNSWLSSINGCMLFKLHPYTKIDLTELDSGVFSNIKLVDRMADINPLLYYADVLITDYSSVYFDFLLTERPIVFFCFDLDSYISECRDLYEPYHSFTPGVKARSFEELLSALKHIDTGLDNYAVERARLRELIWGSYSGEASKDLAGWIERLKV